MIHVSNKVKKDIRNWATSVDIDYDNALQAFITEIENHISLHPEAHLISTVVNIRTSSGRTQSGSANFSLFNGVWMWENEYSTLMTLRN